MGDIHQGVRQIVATTQHIERIHVLHQFALSMLPVLTLMSNILMVTSPVCLTSQSFPAMACSPVCADHCSLVNVTLSCPGGFQGGDTLC